MSKSLELIQEASKFMSDLDAIDPRIFEAIDNPSSQSLDWTIAEIIWENAVAGNENALAMVHELFVNKDEVQIFLERSKKEQSQNCGKKVNRKVVMTATAIAIIGFGLEDKLQKFLHLEKREKNHTITILT